LWDEYQSQLFALSAEEHDWQQVRSHGTCKNVVSDIFHDSSKGNTWLVIGCSDTASLNVYEIVAWKSGQQTASQDGAGVLHNAIAVQLIRRGTLRIPFLCAKQLMELAPNKKETIITKLFIFFITKKKNKFIICCKKKKNIYIYTFYVSSVQIMTGRKQKYVVVGTNKGRIYDYPLGDTQDITPPENVECYINPYNKSAGIAHMHRTASGQEVVYVTAFGWQRMPAPGFEENDRSSSRERDESQFCSFENNIVLSVSSVVIDMTSQRHFLYIGTSTGELFIYDLKQRLKRNQRCRPVDHFSVGNDVSSLTLFATSSGHLFVGTNSGLYVYNQSQVNGAYERLELSFVKYYDSDFERHTRSKTQENAAETLRRVDATPLLSVFQILHWKAVIAYGGGGCCQQKLESFFFFFCIYRALGIAIIFFIFIKGKRTSDGNASPLTVFGKMFGQGTVLRRNQAGARGRLSHKSRGMNVKERWEMRYPGISAPQQMQTNKQPEKAKSARQGLPSDSD
ncbi:hypothetical protein RFI_35588, partial [Reticulomyxa filosa]